ncbi:MAG: hypothetical protein H7329_06330, partial [Opitutaceae bacterium]|nr:hypothetical protein [Cytophagales bacterium]
MDLIKKITHSGIKDGMGFLEKRKIQMVNTISFCSGIVVTFLLCYFSYLNFPKPVLIILGLYSIINFLTFVFSKYLGSLFAKYVLFISSQITIIIVGSFIANSDVAFHIVAYLWLGTSFSVVFVLFDLKNRIHIFICFLITLISSYIVHHLDYYLQSDFEMEISNRAFFLYGNFVGAFCLNILTILLFQFSYTEYFKELIDNLKGKNRELEEKEGELFTSLEQLRASQAELTGSYDLLKEKQNQLQSLASNVPGVIFNIEIINNAIISFRYVSTRAKDFFEIDIKDIMLNSNAIFNQVLPEFRKDLYSQLLYKGEEIVKLTPEFKVETPSGEIKWIKAEMLCEPVYENKKQVNGVFIDITEEKNKEAYKEKMQKSLLEISNESSTISGDIVNTLKMITDSTKSTLNVDSVSIWLLEKDKNELHCHEHSSVKETDYARDPIDLKQLEYYRYFLDEHKVIIASDAQNHPATKELFQKNYKPSHV